MGGRNLEVTHLLNHFIMVAELGVHILVSEITKSEAE